MPNVNVTIGGRQFEVACQPGEESYLQAAAGLLDAEAGVLTSQIPNLTESRMLLMAGLMLADKTAGSDEQGRFKDEQIAKLQAELNALKSQPAPQAERVEVPVVPAELTNSMAELAARAEAMAAQVEEMA